MQSWAGEIVTFHTTTVTGLDPRTNNDTTTTEDISVPGCVWAPGQTSESVNGGDQVIENGKMYVPYEIGVTLTHLDSATRSNGKKYQVMGEPQDHTSPWTQVHAPIALDFREVTGGSSHVGTGATA
jgi:hypothetical protein